MWGYPRFHHLKSSPVDRLLVVILISCFLLSPVAPAFAANPPPPSIPNATAFNEQSEAPRVDGATGAFTQQVPLDIPPGRNGLQPAVSLQYNSQQTSDSIVGYGWSLSIPYIQRLNKTGSQNLYGTAPYFTSSTDGELAVDGSTTPATIATTSPTIMDSLPLTLHSDAASTSDSFSYTVPAGGQNKVFVVWIASNGGIDSTHCEQRIATTTLNGVTLPPFVQVPGTRSRACYFYSYLVAPTSGTFQINYTVSNIADFVVFTLQNADQVSPIDVASVINSNPASSLTASSTMTRGNDFLISWGTSGITNSHSSFGPGETAIITPDQSPDGFGFLNMTWKAASSSVASEGMTTNWNSSKDIDEAIMGVKPPYTAAVTSTSTIYRARVDDGSHNSYSFANNTWTVYDKSGTRYTYGSSDTGRQYDTGTGTSTKTYKWMLQEIRDTNDNYVKYVYTRDSNEIYPSQIIYTGHGSSDGIDTISFATSTRPDSRISFAPGFKVTTNKRISEIDAAVNGTIVRKYLLGYGTGNNGYRSLLTSVQQQGYDDNNNLTTLPPMTFGYVSSSTPFVKTNGVSSASRVVADVNGDGVNDVTLMYQSPIDYSLGGSVNSTNITPPDYWAGQCNCNYEGHPPYERGVRFIDTNGDGKADVVRGYNDNTGTTNAMYLNTYATSSNVYVWTATTTWSGVIPTFAYSGVTSGIFGDVNGDGLPDFEQSLPGTVGPTANLGNGSAWDATSTVFAPPKDFSAGPTASQLIDVNGDGLDDWVYSDGTNIYVLMNTGTGWQSTPDANWTIATSTLYKSPGTNTYYDRGIRFIDVNGDGLPDFVRSYTMPATWSGGTAPNPEIATVSEVFLNTGSGWAATSTAYSLPSYITTGTLGQPGNTWDGVYSYNEMANWTGNGQMNQDVLATVTNPKGGSTSVTYTPSTQLGTNAELPISLLVVTQTVTNDGRGNTATTTYTYSGGKMYLASGVRDRKFAGFWTTTTNAPDSISTIYFNQGDWANAAFGEQSDGYAQINHPFRKDVFDLSNNIKQRTYYRWDAYPHASSTFVGLGRQMVEDFAADGTHRDKATDYSYSSTTDDLIKTTQYGEVTGNSDGTFTDIGSDLRTTNISYAASSSVNMSLRVEKTVLDNNGATSTDQKLYYDSLGFGQVSLGNGTRQEDWITGSTYASSTKIFNSFGLVATSTDRRGNATAYVYDAYNLFVATSTNPLLQKTQFLYNYANGKVKQSTDPNSRLTKNIYDGIGRLLEVDQSDVASPTTYATSTTYLYTDSTSTPSSVHRSDWLTSTNTVDTYDYYDGLNRVVQERKVSETAGMYAAFDRIYNTAGELSSQSIPYFSSGSSFTNPTSQALLLTDYSYDPLQRMLTTGNIVGTTTNAYAKWTTTTTDPDGNVKDFSTDAFGNLATVVEHGTALATTTYAYDSLNDLATTTDSAGNVRHFTYDGLGRRLTGQDLHAPAAGTFGTWSYGYDDGGNLTSQTDPKSQVVNRTYDALNRMTTEDYTGQSGTEVTDTYDSCANGIGYLCTASSTSALTSNVYDILGRVAIATTTVNGTGYATSYGYDRQSDVTNLTYPDSSQVSYAYNLAGLPSRVQRKPAAGSFADVISNFDYAPHGRITNTLFANGASSTNFYNASAMYRLSQLQTIGVGGMSIQNFAYTYDPAANLTMIANTASSSASATVSYAYDALNRLLYASTISASSSPYSQAFTYDSLGNMLTNALVTGSSTAATTSPTIMESLPLTLHSDASVTSDSFSYTVPAGGQNKVFVVWIASNGGIDLTHCEQRISGATLNGVSLPAFVQVPGTRSRACYFYSYLVAPTSGTFQINYNVSNIADFVVFTLQNADQISPIDVSSVINSNPASSLTASSTTTRGNDFLISWGTSGITNSHSSFGAGETAIITPDQSPDGFGFLNMTWKAASSSIASESMTTNWNSSKDIDEAIMGVKRAPVSATGTTTPSTYTYAGTGYANPDAVTQIANGISTTTLLYDNNGNLMSSGNGSATTTYTYDYANRLIALFAGGATTTYGYDAFGSRVLQTGTTTTYIYPSKFYSVASSTVSGAKYATTTEYVFNGDTLLSTVDQQFASGIATGTPQTRYIHPDHLGSTNVVTDQNGALAQTLDYYPYGATRISVSTSTNERRQYIGQFTDNSNLSYLNSRYYNSAQGQFISQDPIFWELGLTDDGKRALFNPQVANAYGYSADNPITNKDPNGRCPQCGLALLGAGGGLVAQYGYDVYNNIQSGGLNAGAFYNNLSSPKTYFTRAVQGAIIGATGGFAGALTTSVAGQAAIVGVASGAFGAGSNAYLGDPVTPQSVISDTVFGGLTFGFGEMVPKVPGRLPNFGTDAFVFGKHAQQSGLQLSYSAVSSYMGQIFGSFGNTQQGRNAGVQGYNASIGASSPQSKLWTTPSGAVVGWGGNIILGPTSISTPSTSRKRSRRRWKTTPNGTVTVYKPKFSVAGGGLVVLALIFFGLTLPLVVEGSPVPQGQLLGLGALWLLGIAATVVPLGGRLEVGSDYITTYLFGFRTTPVIHRSDVQVMDYGNIFRGGLGYGKGIKFWALTGGKSRAYSVAEAIYGNEAIADARRVLSSSL